MLSFSFAAKHSQVGREGEAAAVSHLTSLGWIVLDRNWRYRHLELDAVFDDYGTVAFVEVKTRALGSMQRPDEALTPLKSRNLTRAACAWLSLHKAWNRPCRFDLACVTSISGTYQVELIKNVIIIGEESRNAVGRRYSPWQPW